MEVNSRYLSFFQKLGDYAKAVNDDPRVDSDPRPDRVVIDGETGAGEALHMEALVSKEGEVENLMICRGDMMVNFSNPGGPQLTIMEHADDEFASFELDRHTGERSALIQTRLRSTHLAKRSASPRPWLEHTTRELGYLIAEPKRPDVAS